MSESFYQLFFSVDINAPKAEEMSVLHTCQTDSNIRKTKKCCCCIFSSHQSTIVKELCI